jgi:hypothetical protein
MIYRHPHEALQEEADSFQKLYEEQLKRVARLQEDLSRSVQKAVEIRSNRQLNKLASSIEFGDALTVAKGLVDEVNEEIGKLNKLAELYVGALERANAAGPDFIAYASEMQKTISRPVECGRFFVVERGAKMTDVLPTSPASKPSVDPRANLSDVTIARRFQKE